VPPLIASSAAQRVIGNAASRCPLVRHVSFVLEGQMKGIRFHGIVAAAALVVGSFTPAANAAVTSVSQNSVPGLDVLPPQIEATPLGEESFAYVDRTHELTSARVDATSGLLTTNAAGNLVGFPSYLLGAQVIANANDNRTAGTDAASNDYLVTYTVDTPSTAYLLLDNRLDGTASNATSSPNSTDPDLGGNLAWVLADGWTRVNTGMMPNGQADYIGIDEGGSVASPDLRTHHDAGPGVSLNQFFAIYSREVTDSFVTRGIKQGTGSGNMYVVAVVPVPEPGAIGLVAAGAAALLARRARR
jgi:hypothetical protein